VAFCLSAQKTVMAKCSNRQVLLDDLRQVGVGTLRDRSGSRISSGRTHQPNPKLHQWMQDAWTRLQAFCVPGRFSRTLLARLPRLIDKPAWKVNALPGAIGERHRVTEPAAMQGLIRVWQCHDGINGSRDDFSASLWVISSLSRHSMLSGSRISASLRAIAAILFTVFLSLKHFPADLSNVRNSLGFATRSKSPRSSTLWTLPRICQFAGLRHSTRRLHKPHRWPP
jgi:hypothetical protein